MTFAKVKVQYSKTNERLGMHAAQEQSMHSVCAGPRASAQDCTAPNKTSRRTQDTEKLTHVVLTQNLSYWLVQLFSPYLTDAVPNVALVNDKNKTLLGLLITFKFWMRKLSFEILPPLYLLLKISLTSGTKMKVG